ncbi:MAG: polymer-forming cytoskeletal protein [Proteobacteria bacterium]|nr:polymer-forming cytoskeletal protein [Pseudomonadota bacterium]
MARNNRDANQINGLIDRGCSVEGKLAFDGTVQINGDFTGEILSDGTLIVGPEAKISARIQIDTIIIEGSVQGTVEAKQKVELRRGANLTGDIEAPALVVEEGAVFQGRSQMLLGASTQVRAAGEMPASEGAFSADESADSLMM